MHGVVVLLQASHLVAAPDLDAETACVVLQECFELRLGESLHLHRRLVQLGEIDVDAAERKLGGDRRPGRVIEQVPEFAVAQQVEDLAADAAGFGDLADVGEPLQDKWFDSGQAEFGGERQAGRSGAHDDHVSIRHASPSRRSSCSYVAAQRFWSMRGVLPQAPGCAIC